MSRQLIPIRALVAIVLPLVACAVIDVAFTQPQLRTVKRLAAQRAELLEKLTEASERERRSKRLAQFLEVDDLTQLATLTGEDPLTYVASMVKAARLTQLELTAGDSGRIGSYRRARFTVRLQGSYERTLDFVRMLEEGARLASIDALVVKRADSRSVENRFNISIYDPVSAEAM